MKIGRNLNFNISPSQKNEKIVPSPRKNELINPSKNSNNFLLNPSPKGKKTEHSASPRGDNKRELKVTPSPKMGWDNNNFHKKSNLTSEIDYIQAKIQDFNNSVIKTPEKNKFPIKEPFSAQKDDRIKGTNMAAVPKKSFNEVRTVTPKKDRDLMNFAVFTNDNQKKTFNEFNASPKKDKSLMNFAPFSNQQECTTQSFHNHKKSYNDTFQSSTPNRDTENNNKFYTPEPKSAREQYKLISPENKDKISLDFLMKSNVSTKSNANNNNIISFNNNIINNNNMNNNNVNNNMVGNVVNINNNNYTVTATTIPNNNNSSAKKLQTQTQNTHGLSPSPNKLKHTQSSLLNELEAAANNANKSIIKKSFDVTYVDDEKKGFGTPFKTLSQFDAYLPQNSLAMTSKSSKESATLKKNDKTDELKQMAFEIFKPKKQESIEKSQKLQKLPETNTPAIETHEKPEKTLETPIEIAKSKNSFSIEDRKEMEGKDEVSFRKLSFGNKLLENVMEENSEKTPLFSIWDSTKLNEGKSEKKKDEESQKSNEKLTNKQKDEEKISRFSLGTNYPTGKPREKSLEKPDLTLASFENTLEKPLNEIKDQEKSNPLENTVKIQEISSKKNAKNQEKREESPKKQEEEEIDLKQKRKASIKSEKETENNRKKSKKSDDKMSPESLKLKSNFMEIEESHSRNVVIPEKQSFSITITEPSIINDDRTTSKESSNSITSIIMKRSKQLNKTKTNEIEVQAKIDEKKLTEKIEKPQETEKIEKNANIFEKEEEINKEEEKSPLKSSQKTDFTLEEIPKKRSISCKNTKESPMKKSLKLRKESDDNDRKFLKAKAPNSGDKKVSFTDVKTEPEGEVDKKISYKIQVSEFYEEENKGKISKKLCNSENLSNIDKNTETERKKSRKSSKDEENEKKPKKKSLEKDEPPKKKKSSKESIVNSENPMKTSSKDLKKAEISPELENSEKKSMKKSRKKSSVEEKKDENSPNLKAAHPETNTLKKKPSKPLDDQSLDDLDKGHQEVPVLIKKGSKTTKNQEVAQKDTDKLMFPKSPKTRPKSVQRERKNTEEEIKMDFLNLNEFISTLGRGN